MFKEQFLLAKNADALIGFARLRKHSSCDEYCTLGVLESERSQGIAKKITEAIIKKSTQDLYLVCVIPQYFENLNFKIVNEYPLELKKKLDYCLSELTVEENYVVMKHQIPLG
jgi:N-acetylglutamate synthase-like GNAT family acetyltransferase